MKRKELFAVVYISLGEAPDNKTLRETGITMQEYADELFSDFRIISSMGNEVEIDEVKAITRVVEE